MPPKKKSEKAIAAEVKKQNTLKAQNILDDLRKEMGKSESGGASVVKKPSRKKPETGKPVPSNKKPIKAKDVVPNSKLTPPIITNVRDNAPTTNSETTMSTVSNSAAMGSGGSVDLSDDIGLSEITETPPNRSTFGTELIEISKPTSEVANEKPVVVSNTRSSHSSARKTTENVANKKPAVVSNAGSSQGSARKTGNVANKKFVVGSKGGSSHGSSYQYEIDCKKVADSIDVKDLKIHLEKHLKINGKKENLGSAVSIVCEGQKVVIKSETFFPKKSLRFLSKKFLKKNWNIRVLSKNVHSYEYKYVGTPLNERNCKMKE